MTAAKHRPPPLLEWILVAGLLLWHLAVPVTGLAGVMLAPSGLEGTGRQLAMAGVVAGLQLGAILVALALARLLFHSQRLFLVALALGLSTGWAVLSQAAYHLVPAEVHYRARLGPAALQLALGIPFLLGLGGWAIGRVHDGRWRDGWRAMGLAQPGALGWAAGAAGLVLWPWLIVGSLGDATQSAIILGQSLVDAALTEGLWRGLALALLLIVTGRRWTAALMGGFLFLGHEMGVRLAGGDWSGLWQPLSLLPLTLMVTALWAHNGPGRHSIWAPIIFHTLYRAVPRLFADPRPSSPEPIHLLVGIGVAALTAVLALALFIGRRARTGRARPRATRGRAVLVAVVPWAAALALYVQFGVPGFHNDGYLIILREQAGLDAGSRADLHARLVATAGRTQGPLRAELDRRGVSYRPYYLVNMIRVDGTTRGMNQLAGRADVQAVVLNPNVRRYAFHQSVPYGYPPPDGRELPWGVDSIDADLVWELGATGAGVVVGGQDTGYQWDHPELKDNYRGWNGSTVDHNRNWHDAWGDSPVPFDDEKHGTHTMGTAVGKTVGVAPDAQWIGCRNMRRGVGNPGSYVECMEFLFAPYPLGGDPFRESDPGLAAGVIVNSWGCPPEEGCTGPEPIARASEAMRAAGILMVVSAGNEGPACRTVWIPADMAANLSVGASDRDGRIVAFSSRGPAGDGLVKPEVTAPGFDIVSSVPGGGYGSASGTSMAGPHVAGVVALMWSANPNLIGDVDRTVRILAQTADPVRLDAVCPVASEPCACDPARVGEVPNNVYGYGIVNAPAAIRGALAPDD